MTGPRMGGGAEDGGRGLTNPRPPSDRAGEKELLWGMGEDPVVMTAAWPRDKLPTPLRFFPSVPFHWSVAAPQRGPLLT